MTSVVHMPMRLELARNGGGHEKAAAWFILGQEPRLWLAEMCAWGISLEKIRVLVLPWSLRDRRPCGALALVPGELADQVQPSPLAEPYRCLEERLYLPQCADLFPPMTAVELQECLTMEVQAMHPAVGLVGCRKDELLAVADLIDPPRPFPMEWGLAVPGVVAEANLRSVKPAPVQPIDDFMEESAGDIGDNSPEDLPALPGESALGNLAAQGAAGILGALSWIASHLGGNVSKSHARSAGGTSGGSGSKGWMKRLSGWSAARLRALNDALQAARNREIGRLMRLLESNPDEGLRYAMPMVPEGARGRAPPGWRLPRRNIGFSLRSIFSSRPSDPWNTEWQVRQKIMARYRELATRELRLGRYRRAAYIFAELLRDMHGAANALRQGRFHREAAALYLEKLKDRSSAAECMEQGGLLAEAIDLYEQLRRFEKVGDLHRKLDHEDQAEQAYRQAVSALLAKQDSLAAARLLMTKLNATDESIEILSKAWPGSNQAALCLEELFAVLDRSVRHEQSAIRIRTLRDQEPDSQVARPLADVLAKVATTYSSTEIRHLAADATRVVAGQRLPEAGKLEARQLVNAVARVAVEDRLLARDAHRFLDQMAMVSQVADVAKPKPPVRSRVQSISIVCVNHLGRRAQWRTAISTGSIFYALGVEENQVVVARGNWNGQVQYLTWREPAALEADYRLEHRAGMGLIVINSGRTQRLSPQNFPAQSYFPSPGFVGCPSFFPPGVLFDASVNEEGTIWLLHATDTDTNMILDLYSASGELRSTQRTPLEVPRDGSAGSVRLVVRGDHVCITSGSQLWVQDYGRQKWTPVALHRSVVSVYPSTLHVPMRLAISYAEGGCIFWPSSQRMQSFAPQLIDPISCLLADGALVAAGRRNGLFYRVDGYSPVQLGKFTTSDSSPVAVVPTHDPDEFAEFLAEGAVRVYRVR